MSSPEEIENLSASFEEKSPQEIVAWAIAAFPSDIALSSSFQTDSVPLLHIVIQLKPDIPIFFLETGFHFWETLLFREQLQHLWQLNTADLRREERWRTFLHRFGRDLPSQFPDLCCFIHKVQPMQRALKGFRAWITGIRRDQTSIRAHAKILELQPDNLLKINPLLNWTKQDVWEYLYQHNLPQHPLTGQGYTSIGCAPCTQPITMGEDERAGRWAGQGKTECGLHTEMFKKEPMFV